MGILVILCSDSNLYVCIIYMIELDGSGLLDDMSWLDISAEFFHEALMSSKKIYLCRAGARLYRKTMYNRQLLNQSWKEWNIGKLKFFSVILYPFFSKNTSLCRVRWAKKDSSYPKKNQKPLLKNILLQCNIPLITHHLMDYDHI